MIEDVKQFYTETLKEDLKYQAHMIVKMYRQLEAYEKAENEINELIRQYNTNEMSADMLVSHLRVVVRRKENAKNQ